MVKQAKQEKQAGKTQKVVDKDFEADFETWKVVPIEEYKATELTKECK
jgi:3-dehydroquinate synthase class II